MRSTLSRPAIVVALIALCISRASAAPPQLVNYQGEVTDGGVPVANGNYPMEFRIYALSAGGAALWSEAVANVPVSNGRFNVLLGQGTALPENTFDGTERWLEAVFNGQVMTPRVRLVTVPYAHRISTVDGATGGDISTPVTINTNSAGNSLEVFNTDGGRAGRFENTLGTNNEAALLGVGNGAGPGVAGYNPNGGPAVHSIGPLAVQDMTFTQRISLNPGAPSSSGEINVYKGAVSTVTISGAEVTTGGQIVVRDNAGTDNIILDGDQSGGRIEVFNGPPATVAGIISGHVQLGLRTQPNLVMDQESIIARNNSATSVLHLQPHGGQVGIGIETEVIPAGYILGIDGKAIMEEVEVQLSADWPDYVFEPGYELMPLDELEDHVRAKKHLPGIPSAADMNGERLALGEMQTKLLEKVEELTLYVLTLNKQVRDITAENEALRARVETLSSQSEPRGHQ